MSRASFLLCLAIFAFGFVGNGSGHEVQIYELQKGDFHLKVTNFGARIISVVLPDKNGNLGDVVLGYDFLSTYVNDPRYFGAVVGRVANRIAGANFTLHGKDYILKANEKTNMLHGGSKGFSQRIWEVEKFEKDCSDPYITLSYLSADGEEGFPGDLQVTVTYALLEPYKLNVSMTAKALNKDTPVSLAQHSYWNLGDHNSGDILSDEVQIFASHITPVNKYLIPTGEISSVVGTPFDFLKSHCVGDLINGLPNGYDINYVLDGDKDRNMKLAAVVHSKKSGRVLNLYTNAPNMQFYTVNYMKNVAGKGGYIYTPHAALCLETQEYPNSVNQPNFPSEIVTPGKDYEHYILYDFYIEKAN